MLATLSSPSPPSLGPFLHLNPPTRPFPSQAPPPQAQAAHPTGATPGGGEGGARSSRGPNATPSARTAGPGAGARRATRLRCWSRKRSVSAWCSGSVGGSRVGPTGPAASADRQQSGMSWAFTLRPLRAQGSPQGSPRRARQASAAASSGTRGAGSARRKPLMPSARAAESHCSRSLRDQSVGAGGRCLWGCWGRLPVPPPVEALPHLCMGAAAQACRGIRCLDLVGEE